MVRNWGLRGPVVSELLLVVQIVRLLACTDASFPINSTLGTPLPPCVCTKQCHDPPACPHPPAAGKVTATNPSSATPDCTSQARSWTVDPRWGNLQLSQVRRSGWGFCGQPSVCCEL